MNPKEVVKVTNGKFSLPLETKSRLELPYLMSKLKYMKRIVISFLTIFLYCHPSTGYKFAKITS